MHNPINYRSLRIKLFTRALIVCLLTISINGFAFNFQAKHDVVFDGSLYFDANNPDDYFQIDDITFSKNGNRLAFSGRYYLSCCSVTSYKLFVMNFDGSNLLEIPLPIDPPPMYADTMIAENLAINDDGSILYFITPLQQESIYRVDISENPMAANVVQIADLGALHLGLARSSKIQTTSSGDWVYYTYSNNLVDGGQDDMYRISSTGMAFETVVQDIAVPISNDSGCIGFGNYVSSTQDFSISNTGANILFQIGSIIYDNCSNNEIYHGWFSQTANNTHQFTDDINVGNSGGVISGDGEVLVISDSGDNKYKLYTTDGVGGLEIEDRGFNFAGAFLNEDGSQLFYADNSNPTGRISNTNGSGGKQILPKSSNQTVSITQIGGINNAMRSVVYTVNAGLNDRVYAGQLYSGAAVQSAAPIVSDISFDPAYIVEGSTGDVIIYINAQTIEGDVYVVNIDNIVDSRYSSNFNGDFSHHFPSSAYDNGAFDDEVAGDGIWTARAYRTGGFKGQNIDNLNVRVSVIDTMGNISVADQFLHLGIFASGFE